MKNIFVILTAVAALFLVSCSDWTKTESKEYPYRTEGEKNPEAYQKYLYWLNVYKTNEHKVTMVTIEGAQGVPTRQNQHPASLPDSVDIVCMTNVGNMAMSLADEIRDLHKTKGTNVVCMVDYLSIQNEWEAMIRAEVEADPDYDPDADIDYDPEGFAIYCKEQTEKLLSCQDKYGFHGIVISYMTSTQGLGAVGQPVFFDCINAWRASHQGHEMYFRGYPKNIADEYKAILEDCKYLIFTAGTAVENTDLTLAVRQRLATDTPTDRCILEVAIPTLDDPAQVGATPQQAAEWVNIPYDRFDKVGLSVNNAQDDYFYVDSIYKNIRRAIQIMNPATNN